MLFCPYCHLILNLKKENAKTEFICPNCDFVEQIDHKIIKSHELIKKKKDEIFTKDSDTPLIEINCPECGNLKAYFIQMQTRSADEPATIFYKCENNTCNYTWKEN